MMLRKLSTSHTLSPPLYKFAFALLLVGLAFALTYTDAANTFSTYDVTAILVLGTAVNVPLLVGALLLLRRSELLANAILSLVVLTSVATAYININHTDLFAGEYRINLISVGVATLFVLFVTFRAMRQQRWGLFLLQHATLTANTTLSLVVLASVASAYIIHTDLYTAGNHYTLITICVAALFALFVAFRVIDQQRWGGVTLSVVVLVGLGIVLGKHFLEHYDSTRPVEVDLSNIQHVSFREKPNLYFISFESLIPRSLLKKYYGTDASPFHDLFDAHFRRFPNFFSEEITTRGSLNMILALDKEMYFKSSSKYRNNLFSGVQPSPLLNILRNNGYETSSFYHSTWLGQYKGPYIEHYTNRTDPSVCAYLSLAIQPIAFWGYCTLPRPVGWRSLAKYIEYSKGLTANDRPQFLMAHIDGLPHTFNEYRYDDQAKRHTFISRYTQSLHNGSAVRDLEAILEHLKHNDPNAILYVYGDHGAGLSQGVSFEDNPMFVVQDRLGVLGGIYPPDVCATYFDETLSKGYMTTLDGVHAILRCVSGGQSALKTPRELPIPAHGTLAHGIIPRSITRSYKEFLYE